MSDYTSSVIIPDNTDFDLGLVENLRQMTAFYNPETYLTLDLGSGILARNVVDYVNRTVNGGLVGSFTDIYYNRFWATPQTIDISTIPVNTGVDVQVWNAFFTDKTFTGITHFGNTAGVILPGVTLSGIIPALETQSFGIFVTNNVASYVNGGFTVNFASGETVTVYITGTRLNVFPHEADWSNTKVSEYYSYLTDIKTFDSGKEQRTKRRKFPRRGFSFESLTLKNSDLNDAALAQKHMLNLLNRGYGKNFLVPIWQDCARLNAEASIGATSLNLDNLSGKDFEAGKFVMLHRAYDDYEVFKVDTIVGNTLNLAGTLTKKWLKGSKVLPCNLAILAQDEVGYTKDKSPYMSRFNFSWSILVEENKNLSKRNIPYSSSLMYRGYTVHIPKHDWAFEINGKVTMRQRILDFQSGIFITDPAWSRTKEGWSYSLSGDRELLKDMLAFYNYCCGAWKAFYIPTQTRDFQKVALGTAGDNQIKVKFAGIAQAFTITGKPFDIYVSTNNRCLHVINVIDNQDGTETLVLDAPLDFTINSSLCGFISSLKLVRFEDDTFDISWETDTICNITLNVIEVFDGD